MLYHQCHTILLFWDVHQQMYTVEMESKHQRKTSRGSSIKFLGKLYITPYTVQWLIKVMKCTTARKSCVQYMSLISFVLNTAFS